MKSIKVSILVPVYKVEKLIARCAESLFSQTYDNIEYVFVDDRSPDGSINVLQAVLSNYPARVESVKIVRHEHNMGLAAARNTAVREATGEFICHVDSDDWIDLDAVREMVEQQILDDADIVSMDADAFYSDHNTRMKATRVKSGEELTKALLVGDERSQVWGRLIRRNLYVNNSVTVKEGVNMAEDFQVMPILSYYSEKVTWVDANLYHYNCISNSNSYTSSYSETSYRQARESVQIVRNFFWDKNPQYVELLDSREPYRYFSYLRSAMLFDFSDVVIKELRSRISEFNKSELRKIPARLKMYYWINSTTVCRFLFRIKRSLQ